MTDTMDFARGTIAAQRREKVAQLYKQYHDQGIAITQIIMRIGIDLGVTYVTIRADLKSIGIL